MHAYRKPFFIHAVSALALCWSAAAAAAPDTAVLAQVQKQKDPLLATLKDLVSIESGSKDREGLDRISQLVHDRLKALGGQVEFIEPGQDAYRMHDTPEKIGRMVRATFKGNGSKKILLIAHMDTVYLKGMLAKQPFRIDGNRAYGLGIGDDKAGVAVILHTLATLKSLDARDFGTLTVLINGDEEISSPASRALFTKLGAEHDLTMSFEGSPVSKDHLSLATAGIAAVTMKVTGKASHAGAAPELGRNAIYELVHQIQQTKDFSDPARGLKMNWTMISGGTNRNVIPAEAQAAADARAIRVSDFDALETRLRDTVRKQSIPDAKVDMQFERRRPPLELRPAAVKAGEIAKRVYAELDKNLIIDDSVQGGGTDAAFAGLNNQNAVLERFGLLAFGAHSNDNEYILIDSIEPRLYLATRLIMEFSRQSP
ncbi:glutamate carboxypeptidase [Noviherbaspirillum galbum]|uniref:M20/M25/M40 family metallo-hydrolase n=1 Tax=Noviherbaspirillum galbum TaxID=2709383 RepID=A0A6B3ST41_9BURK|nr:glutamate carboxypeptidase [Noviherbaspirillum galbum]NEX63937.1 M20/M25/M40 family metallo-hydrolase [Noviherbaspirillum galbum]